MIELIIVAALNAHVNINLLKAVCYTETKLVNVNTHHDGQSISYGPCQAKRVAARQVAMNDIEINNPLVSIEVAAKYLKYSIEKCGSIESGLAHYNSGRCLKVFKHGGYVNKVMNKYYEYEFNEKLNAGSLYCENFWNEF